MWNSGKIQNSQWRGNLPAFAVIVFVGALLYGHTLNVPWYLDDLRAIVENRTIHQLSEAVADLFSGRGLTNLTFALNYRFGGTDVFGYHLVNITIHLVTACLVFLLFKRVFRERLLLAVGGALVFVAHPLQTQAVTYIVQRMTSLAALFFFLAVYLYVRARESSDENSTLHWLFYGGALFCGALAVLTKQNTAVLPVALILFDRYFLLQERRITWKKLLLYSAPFALVPVAVAIRSLVVPLLTEGGISHIGGMPDLVHLRNLSPVNYLVTEFSVIWVYLRLLFIPYGQALDYDLPIVATIWQWKNALAFAGILGLLATAAFLRKRMPYISFGILWFFLGLAVESTIIPLDPVFEHRLYIPMFGFAMVIMAAVGRLNQRHAMISLVLLLAVLSALTWQRNALWNDPVAFHTDNLRKAPRSERVHLDLANVYRKQGNLEEAQRLYERALQINPGYVLIHINLSMVYAAQGQHQKAADLLLEGIRISPYRFKLYNNLGAIYNYMGRHKDAALYLKKGAELEPYNAMVHFNLASAYYRLGLIDQAVYHYQRSIELEPNDPEKYFNLGLALHRKGNLNKALQAFQTAGQINPGHASTWFNAGLVSVELGDFASAQRSLAQLRRIDPELAQQLEHRFRQ